MRHISQPSRAEGKEPGKYGVSCHRRAMDWPVKGDTTSTYFELDGPDELAEVEDTVDDDGVTRPAEDPVGLFG